MSEREAGKTVAWITKAFKLFWKKHRTTIVLRNMINDITETYIADLGTALNKFLPDNKKVKLSFKKGSIKEGILNVYIKDGPDRPFLRIIALSNPMSRIKSLTLEAPGMIVWDEYILNTRAGEKYEPQLILKFEELYNTYLREAKWKFKVYMFGNPYSRYHPVHSWLHIDYLKLKQGAFIVGDDYVVECYQIKEELKQAILAKNPLYKFDDTYKKYAFDGSAINDTNFTVVAKQPDNYRLAFIFRINGKYLNIYRYNKDRDMLAFDAGKFWINTTDSYTGSNKVWAVDFNNLVVGTQLISNEVRSICWRVQNAVANRDVSFGTIEAGYLTELIYPLIK